MPLNLIFCHSSSIFKSKMYLTISNFKNESMLDVVDAVRQTGDGMNEKLSSLQEQLMQVTQDVSRMSLPQVCARYLNLSFSA